MRAWLAWLLCWGICAHKVKADVRWTIEPYLLVSPDKSLCLVMQELTISTNGKNYFATLPDGRRIDLHTQFSSNGVFRLPDLQPVYFLDWFDHSNRFVASSDFNSIVRISQSELAPVLPVPAVMRFYNAGREIRSYGAGDLIEGFREGPGLNTVSWPDHVGYTPWLDDFHAMGPNEVEVVTTPRGLFWGEHGIILFSGNRYVFDLATGRILSEKRPMLNGVTTIAVLLLGFALLIATWFLRRKPGTS